MSPPTLLPRGRPERVALVALLDTCTVSEIAGALGVHESTVYRWIAEEGLKPPTVSDEGPRNARLELRTTSASRERWLAAAERAGVSASEWARVVLDEAALRERER